MSSRQYGFSVQMSREGQNTLSKIYLTQIAWSLTECELGNRLLSFSPDRFVHLSNCSLPMGSFQVLHAQWRCPGQKLAWQSATDGTHHLAESAAGACILTAAHSASSHLGLKWRGQQIHTCMHTCSFVWLCKPHCPAEENSLHWIISLSALVSDCLLPFGY